jgi:GT2 family glycosyltransferase
MTPRLTIGITTRNRPGALDACLRSLAAVASLAPEILVYDDGSEPSAETAMGGRHPGVRFLRGTLGCAGGRNVIAREASHEFVLQLDDDTLLFDAAAVTEALAAIAADPAIGAIAFAQANRDGTRWAASMQPSPVMFPAVVNTFIGFAHLVRRSTFLELGGFRDLFEYFGEEKEFCLRLIDAGRCTVYLPHALIAHVTDPGTRDARRYLRLVSRNDCLISLYDDPFARMLWMVPARLALYFRMRRGWKIHDPGGAWWVVRELARHFPRVWRDRRPVRRATLDRWRTLRARPEPYGSVGDRRASA